MERVAFLIEQTGDRIECLLNPETFTITRQAGLRPQRTLAAALTGTAQGDNLLLATGGGTTELLLDLLFDVSKQVNAGAEDSVQTLTAPLWQMAENSDDGKGHGAPPIVRFVWGKSWNIPAVVASVAERFEQFTASGIPRRSWIRMRLLRCDVPSDDEKRDLRTTQTWSGEARALPAGVAKEDLPIHDVEGGGRGGAADDDDSGGSQTERIELLAFKYYGDASQWRLLAAFNNIDNPSRLAPGTSLMVPPLEAGA